MGTLNRMLNTAKSFGNQLKTKLGFEDKPKVINEVKEKNEQHDSGGGTWRQNQGRYRTGWIKKMLARRKAKRKSAHNSTRVNNGGKKK